jgi:hypothetical protein
MRDVASERTAARATGPASTAAGVKHEAGAGRMWNL